MNFLHYLHLGLRRISSLPPAAFLDIGDLSVRYRTTRPIFCQHSKQRTNKVINVGTIHFPFLVGREFAKQYEKRRRESQKRNLELRARRLADLAARKARREANER